MNSGWKYKKVELKLYFKTCEAQLNYFGNFIFVLKNNIITSINRFLNSSNMAQDHRFIKKKKKKKKVMNFFLTSLFCYQKLLINQKLKAIYLKIFK